MDDRLKQRLVNVVHSVEDIDRQLEELRTQKSEAVRAGVDAGLDRKALRQVLRDRRMDAADLATHQQLVGDYENALGMTPIEAAIEAAREAAVADGDGAKPRGRRRGRDPAATLQ